MGIFGSENSCGRLFCPSGYQNPGKNGEYIDICQYRPGNCTDETARPRWACPGHITCLNLEPGAPIGRASRTRLGSLGWKSMAKSVCRSLLCSVVMGIAIRMAALFMVPDIKSTLPGLIGGVAGSIAIGLCIYSAGSYILKSPELSRVLIEAGRGIGEKWPRHKAF